MENLGNCVHKAVYFSYQVSGTVRIVSFI